MVLKWLFHYFANNEQFINRLADSYPIRRAARFVVYLFATGKDTVGKIQGGGLRSITERYQETIREAKEEFKQAAEELKKQSKKR